MAEDLLSPLLQIFVGRTCAVERQENHWAFAFGEGADLGVGVPWRIVTNTGIAFADTDDNQLFGLPQPVDGQALTNELLAGRRVIGFHVDAKTADIRILFEGDVRLEMFNNSSGYEGWSAVVQKDGKMTSVLGLGGGEVAIY